MTIEDLAVMVKRGFDQTASKDELKATRDDLKDLRKEVDRRFVVMAESISNLAKAMDENFRHVYSRLDTLRYDISDLPTMRNELRSFRTRLERLEKKV